MLMELNRADSSQIHVALLDALSVAKDGPTTPQEASRHAYAEAVAFYSDNPRTSLEAILKAAHAVRTEIEIKTGSAETPIEFGIKSLMMATELKEYDATLVARLCGAMPHQTAKGIRWKNTDAVVSQFDFPKDIID